MLANIEKPKILKDSNEPTIKQEKADFLIEYLTKIWPLVKNDKQAEEAFKFLEENEKAQGIWRRIITNENVNNDELDYIVKEIADKINNEQLSYLLERFETKFFLLEKTNEECETEAKRVLLSASDPLAFNTMWPIIEKLKGDSRCRAIGLITDNVAGQKFKDLFSGQQNKNDFKRVKDKDKNGLALDDFLGATKGEGNEFDTVITTLESHDSPGSSLLFSGKSNFGNKETKLFIIHDGWTGIIARKDVFKNKERMDNIDGIFCNDDLTKNIIHNCLPEFSEDKILAIGSPIVDSIKDESENAEKYRSEGRKKLELKDDETAILYLGDISDDYDKLDNAISKRINEETFAKTVEAAIKIAEQQPNKKIALLICPHPRDPNGDELLNAVNTKTPNNLRIISATDDCASMEESAYAADAVASIISTGNFLAKLRGKKAIFLGYKVGEGEGQLGGKVLEKIFGREIIEKVIKKDKDMSVASSPEEFAEIIKKFDFIESKERETKKKDNAKKSIDQILDVVLK